jgi:hypothetical protein
VPYGNGTESDDGRSRACYVVFSDALAPLGRRDGFHVAATPSHNFAFTLITMRADIYCIADIPSGRLAILGRPRSGDWLTDEIADWKAAGLTDVVTLLEDREIRELDLAGEAEFAELAGLSFEQFSIPDRGVPASSEAAHSLWERLETKIRSGHSVGIHCRAGIGRAGLVAVGVLLGWVSRKAWPGNAPRRRAGGQCRTPMSNDYGSSTRFCRHL